MRERALGVRWSAHVSPAVGSQLLPRQYSNLKCRPLRGFGTSIRWLPEPERRGLYHPGAVSGVRDRTSRRAGASRRCRRLAAARSAYATQGRIFEVAISHSLALHACRAVCSSRRAMNSTSCCAARTRRASASRWTRAVRVLGVAVALAGSSHCAAERHFPLRDPLWVDDDRRAVSVPCQLRPTDDDPQHVSCAPASYVSPLAWDGADNSIFRPLSELFALQTSHEAVNVNALDEVPDSAWFENRLGRSHPTGDALLRGACTPEQILEPQRSAPGSWTIDQGKPNGASLGFRVRMPDQRKYMFKNDAPNQPERATAASVIGAAIYHTVGFNTSCEQVVHFAPELLALQPGLTTTDNSGVSKPFDDAALAHVLSEANRRDGLYRMQASAWLPGQLIGPFRYEGRRDDDPNDVIPHDQRRELRGGRLLAAWLNHFDAREQNSMDSWIARDPRVKDSSPGYVRHYYIDTSDCFGSEWAWDGISRRLGRSYLLDWGDITADFVTLGTVTRPWERVQRRPGFEMFGYFGAAEFDPQTWKNEYPNPAFSAATERDNAWMARILSRFDRADIAALVTLGRFSRAEHARYLAEVLERRLELILERYLLRLSPLADLALEPDGRLCGTDLARRRQLRSERAFRYQALFSRGQERAQRPVATFDQGRFCVALPSRPSHAERYAVVTIRNGAARYALRVHVYDQGPPSGYRLLGIERPELP